MARFFENLGWFDWFVFVLRLATMGLAASFSAVMIRYTIRLWTTLARSDRAWIVGLVIVSLNLTAYVALIVGNGAAVFPDSLSWLVFVLGYAYLWRGLILTRPER